MQDDDWRYDHDLCVRLSSHAGFSTFAAIQWLGFADVALVHRRVELSRSMQLDLFRLRFTMSTTTLSAMPIPQWMTRWI